MKRRYLLISIAVLAGLIAVSAFVPGPPTTKKFVASLNGRSEVPARETPARGSATFAWNVAAEGFASDNLRRARPGQVNFDHALHFAGSIGHHQNAI